MSTPLITIIVPVYNTDKYLRKCIESILSQSFTDWECILVDDGSTDGSPQICDDYAKRDNRIKVFHKENGGVSSARNVGLRNAMGDYICFVDSDDYITPNHLFDFAHNASNSDIVFQGYTLVEGEVERSNSFTENVQIAKTGIEIDNLLMTITELIGFIATICIKTDVIKNNNITFNESIHFREDELFTFNILAKVSSVVLLPGTSYHYQKTLTGLSSQYYPTNSLLRTLVCLQESINQLKEFPKFKQYQTIILNDGYVRAVNNLYHPKHLCHSWKYRISCLKKLINRNRLFPSPIIDNYLKSNNVYILDFIRYIRGLLQFLFLKK